MNDERENACYLIHLMGLYDGVDLASFYLVGG